VYALCACPLAELLKAHRNPDYEFSVEAVTATGDHIPIAVAPSANSHRDNYHYKIAT
jgi:hypothetical protein